MGNRADRFHCGRPRESAVADLVDCSHGGGHTIHIHADGIGRADGEHSGTCVFGLKVQLSPIRNDPGAQIKILAEPLGCPQGLVRRLTVDMQHSGKYEDEIGPFLQTHHRPVRNCPG